MTEEENNLVIEIGIDLMNFIGNSFDKANDITELKSVLKGLGFEDKKDISFDINDVYYQKKDGKNIWECKQFDPLSGGVYIFEIFFKKKTKEDFKKMWNKRASEIYEKTSENGTTKQVKNSIPQYNEQSSENYLYVGSHRTDINSRLKQHFGNNINSTSALKLTDEDIKNEIGNYNITCHRFTLKDDFPKYARAGYIAMIEGILHEKLEPILGKK